MLIAILTLSSNNFHIKVSADTESMLNVRLGWDVLPLYEIDHPPGPICVGENGDLYFADNLNHIIMRMDEFGDLFEYISTGTLDFSDIEYQPNHNRLIGISNNGFYTITSSAITFLKNYTYPQPLSEIAVNPIDDSFYCGSLFDNTDILQFDLDANYLATILTNIQGCSQMVLNNNQSILCYTETYLGSISFLNLSSLGITLIRTGIGLPGTQEVIGIAVDDNDILYSMTADGNERGFYKYQYGTYELLYSSKGGMSSLTWFAKINSFIAGGSVGGCLIGYNPILTEANYLTPIVNSNTIIETNNGTVIYSIENELYQISIDEPILFTKAIDNFTIGKLLLDDSNNIYALLTNDTVTLTKVFYDGSMVYWFSNEILEYGKSIYYDRKNNDIILLTEDLLLNKSSIYRLPIENPLGYSKIFTFTNTTKTVATVDHSGNLFIYEAYNNTLYKIPDGSNEVEIVTTYFANFTGIYGPNFVVEPPLCYSSIENGILIGRNDDLEIWLLDEGLRVTFAINNRGIDNSAIFETINNDLIVTQSTLILKFIYQEPLNTTSPPPSSTNDTNVYYLIPIFVNLTIMLIFQKQKHKNKK